LLLVKANALLTHLAKWFAQIHPEAVLQEIRSDRCERAQANALPTFWVKSCVHHSREVVPPLTRLDRRFAQVVVFPADKFIAPKKSMAEIKFNEV
jgi:hypothetical protein